MLLLYKLKFELIYNYQIKLENISDCGQRTSIDKKNTGEQHRLKLFLPDYHRDISQKNIYQDA